MSWFNRKSKTENRGRELDVGAIYAASYDFGGLYSWSTSPSIIAASLQGEDGSSLIQISRQLSKTSPYLISYRQSMTGGILTGEPEPIVFDKLVPEQIATVLSNLWMESHDCEFERSILHRLIIDGDLLLLNGEIIPSEAFTAVLSGPEYRKQTVGYKIGKSENTRRKNIKYLGDRLLFESRAHGWQFGALPHASALIGIHVGAGHGLMAMSRIMAVIERVSADRTTASQGFRSGVSDSDEITPPRDNNFSTLPVGSMPFLQGGEKIVRGAAGPDAQAMNYEGQLESQLAAALNLPLSEIKSDYSSGSFSNLRMAWVDAGREYKRRRMWLYRHYRLPIYLNILSNAFASGDLPGGITPDIMSLLKRPTWAGPKRTSPTPEKEYQMIAQLAKAGLSKEQADDQLKT